MKRVMQPQSPTKPVMDVAAPPKAPVPAAGMPSAAHIAPVAAAAVAAPVSRPTPPPVTRQPGSAPLPVKAAPSAPLTPVTHSADAAATAPSPAVRTTKAKPPASAQQTHAPVALITITVFVMLVLAGLATIIYMTSQTA